MPICEIMKSCDMIFTRFRAAVENKDKKSRRNQKLKKCLSGYCRRSVIVSRVVLPLKTFPSEYEHQIMQNNHE